MPISNYRKRGGMDISSELKGHLVGLGGVITGAGVRPGWPRGPGLKEEDVHCWSCGGMKLPLLQMKEPCAAVWKCCV